MYAVTGEYNGIKTVFGIYTTLGLAMIRRQAIASWHDKYGKIKVSFVTDVPKGFKYLNTAMIFQEESFLKEAI